MFEAKATTSRAQKPVTSRLGAPLLSVATAVEECGTASCIAVLAPLCVDGVSWTDDLCLSGTTNVTVAGGAVVHLSHR